MRRPRRFVGVRDVSEFQASREWIEDGQPDLNGCVGIHAEPTSLVRASLRLSPRGRRPKDGEQAHSGTFCEDDTWVKCPA
jgi:hypothetical protein